jgi:hypothetical protein
LTGRVDGAYDLIDDLIDIVANLTDRVTALETGGSSGGLGGSLEDILATVREEIVNQTLITIMQNGVFVGASWWIGQQGDDLFAIDAASDTFYQF